MARTTTTVKTKEVEEKVRCTCCGKSKKETEFYISYSEIYKSTGKLPLCKGCIEKLYDKKLDKYNVVSKAIKEVCAILDIY